jgi:hypothetical protein
LTFINGKPIYTTGVYWFGIQWVREEVEFAKFRIIQNELMIFWEACKTDNRSYGMQYVKTEGLHLWLSLNYWNGINEEGLGAKTGADSSKIFKRLIKGLPCFFQPLWTEQMHRRKELLDVPERKK